MFPDEVLVVDSAHDVARIGKVLLLSRDPGRRAGAAHALGESGLRSAYAYLRRALWDPTEEVRLSAVRAVAMLDVGQSEGELAALYAWSSPRIRRAVLRAALRVTTGPAYHERFQGVFSLAAEDPDRRVRAMAARGSR
jgi:HEAT repeat protein